ncbi:MAG: hypothetical protein ABEJ65_06290 [bacterium]
MAEDEQEYSYYKTSQFIPTKGKSFSYYECDDDFNVNRFMTDIPETGEQDRVDVTWTMELRQEGIEDISREKFEELWNQEETSEETS